MDPLEMDSFDIFEIYRRYCDIQSGNGYAHVEEGYRQDDDSKMAKSSRKALSQLLEFVELRLHVGISIFNELSKLMSHLGLMVDSSDFSRFYGFVFYMCRENGQKNITVSRAVTAWRLVLPGRFRLLNQWCSFVEKHQRHNISEDTWHQVLAFSRCVRENLEGYDPEGAWPVLIDDFVEHMYRLSGSKDNSNIFCNCGDSESRSYIFEDHLPGLKSFPGLKRKLPEDVQMDEAGSSGSLFPDTMDLSPVFSFKKSRLISCKSVERENNPPGITADESMEIARHNSPMGCTKAPCTVEGCLSKGIADLFSSRSYLQVDREKRVSFT